MRHDIDTITTEQDGKTRTWWFESFPLSCVDDARLTRENGRQA